MQARPPYAEVLDAIGLYVERAGGADVLASDIETGFLVAFLDDDGQRVVTLGLDELERVRGEGQRRGLGGLFRRQEGGGGETRARLRGVGRHLDGKPLAAAVVVQERATGYSVEYTDLVDTKDDLAGLTRHHEELDDARLRQLAK